MKREEKRENDLKFPFISTYFDSFLFRGLENYSTGAGGSLQLFTKDVVLQGTTEPGPKSILQRKGKKSIEFN